MPWTTPSVAVVRNSYEHAQNHLYSTERRKFETFGARTAIERFTTDSPAPIWMTDGDPRTGTFHQTWVTVGDTACRGCNFKMFLMFIWVSIW